MLVFPFTSTLTDIEHTVKPLILGISEKDALPSPSLLPVSLMPSSIFRRSPYRQALT